MNCRTLLSSIVLVGVGCTGPTEQNSSRPSVTAQETAAVTAAANSLVEFRSIDGSANNLTNPRWGATGVELLRLAPVGYADGISAPAGATRASARAISNAVHTQSTSKTNTHQATDYLWQWGQILDHDIDLTEGAHPEEPLPIQVPTGDPWFDPAGTGNRVIPFSRSAHSESPGVRQQINQITAYIDASFVYGSDTVRARALRTNDGTGQLKTSAGNLLPFNVDGLPNAQPGPGDPATFFLAGDIRANEQVGLASLHTLFVREHNRLAGVLAASDPKLSGEQIYQVTRAIVGALTQVITYNEFLPKLLGTGALAPYTGYQPQVNASISNEFSTAAYRLGHSLLSPQLHRTDANGNAIEFGHLSLRDAFFAPRRIIDEGGIEPILRGLAVDLCQDLDMFVIDDVRNFLFGPPGSGGFDLAALNIQRGRDHGLPSYNRARVALGLAPATTFAAISSDTNVQSRLATAYASVDEVDLWTGAIAEDHLPGALVGPVIATILIDQFERLRDGDRMFYQNYLPPETIAYVQSVRLADIVRRNSTIGEELSSDVFSLAQECAHPVCVTGQALDRSCEDSCVADVCAVDSWCCNVEWDDICVDKVASVCGRTCQEEKFCAHDLCDTGAPLPECDDPCAVEVCAADSWCCNVEWDNICVDKVESICGKTCQ